MLVRTSIDRLPAPPDAAFAYSLELQAWIRDRILASGPQPFEQFMQWALYHPEYGYYMNGLPKFGSDGDFVTAPEVSGLFSHCVGAQCGEVLGNISGGAILEVGAGRGTMAADILQFLSESRQLPDIYYILELSTELQQRQRQTLAQRIPEYLPRVRWLRSLEGFSFSGMVLANEVMDAMPVIRFRVESTGLSEAYVGWDESADRFCWEYRAASKAVHQAVEHIQHLLNQALPVGYVSELNMNLQPWFAAINACLQTGVMLAIDYGYPRSEYYLPERMDGTLHCHYQQHAHADPFCYPGLQDITAHVDFTAAAEAATDAGFELAGFTQQAEFLLSCGLDRMVAARQDNAGMQERLDLAQQMKTLVLPAEMGERFQVLTLTKMYNHPLLGFSDSRDMRHRL